MSGERLILKIQKNKSNNQKYVNIPKNSTFDEGEYVSIEKVEK